MDDYAEPCEDVLTYFCLFSPTVTTNISTLDTLYSQVIRQQAAVQNMLKCVEFDRHDKR